VSSGQAQNRELDERRRGLGMVHGVGGDADIGISVVRQHRVAAVGIAGASRKVAARNIDLDPVAGAENVVDVAEVDGQPFDLTGRQMLRLARGVPIHGADNAVHQQHGAPIRVEVYQLGDEVSVGTAGLDVQGHADVAGDGEVLEQRFP